MAKVGDRVRTLDIEESTGTIVEVRKREGLLPTYRVKWDAEEKGEGNLFKWEFAIIEISESAAAHR